MLKKYTDKEYANMLPKKQVGTAVLFFNTKGELLILKPNYKDGWLIPGGSTDENESPLHCAIRETKEETGLDIQELKLVGIYYAQKKGYFSDSLKFLFNGGVLTDKQISEIQLAADELEEFTFFSKEKAIPILSNSLQKSVPQCIEAIKNKTTAYIEN
jgi:8-oxo-dGTP pyrophosphatase MutT (NUDIX family)